MPLRKIPEVTNCCGCVTDLKTAAAIIATLGIVTSPAIAWAIVRHSYVIRVSCFVTTAATRPDVVDIYLNNILSFGFGANAGLGPSCLGQNKEKSKLMIRANEDPVPSNFVSVVKYVGWIVLAADAVFLISSVYFLFRIFNEPVKKAAQIFIWTCIVSIVLSFIYGMLYISACISVGGSFPIFEFAFSLFDIILWLTWLYFALVIHSFNQQRIRKQNALVNKQSGGFGLFETLSNLDLLLNSSSFLQSQIMMLWRI